MFLYSDNSVKCYRDGEFSFYGSINTDLDVVDLTCYIDNSQSNKKKASLALEEDNDDMQLNSDSEDLEQNSELNYFGLTKDDKLIHNGTLLINDCTSYTVYNDKF